MSGPLGNPIRTQEKQIRYAWPSGTGQRDQGEGVDEGID